MARRSIDFPPHDPLWYKDAVIYQLHVKSFFDSNDDGVGDFAGLTAKLDYIVSLGATAIWLLPFYPSPRKDDGYDISDYLGVHPEYGVIADLRRLVAQAHERGLRIITELVINHTSDQHPWFQRARKAKPGSAARNFYVWSDDDKKYAGTRIIFSDTEKSNWTWDSVANAYFWHRFYSHQPDLNYDNPRLLKSILRVMRFWLALGVDGLRLDAVPYLVEREGTSNENLPETHNILKQIRREMDMSYPGRMLLAEANQWPEDVQEYFGQGDECHMAFHFPLMPRMYMAIAQEDRFPITDIVRQTPAIPENCQWAIFLRNHDELTLEMVTDRERDYLWETYATDRRARINLGIRRRLAPLMERDRRRIELMNSLLLTMPGTPVIYYGDEIGMGDNYHLGDRDGVRTPMQWSSDRNGGFSRADPARLVLPLIMDPVYGYQAVNVEAQERDPHSLLSWMRRMLVVRREHKAFGRGTLRFLQPSNRKALVYVREYEDEKILCVANVSRTAQAVELDLSEFAGYVPLELTGHSVFPSIMKGVYLLTLPPYGFFSFLLCPETQQAPRVPARLVPDPYTFVLRSGLADILVADRKVLEKDILPAYLQQLRWFQHKNTPLLGVTVRVAVNITQRDQDWLLTILDVDTAEGSSQYVLPLGVVWEDEESSPLGTQYALARVRRGRRVGLLTDAIVCIGFVRTLLEHMSSGQRVETKQGDLVFDPTPRLTETAMGPDPEIEWPGAEQSNSSVLIGRQAILKLLRRVIPGIHPEAEMGRVLTERGFSNVAPMLGEMVHHRPDGTRTTLAILQGFVGNQGDGWTWTLAYLGRMLDELLVRGEATEAGRESFEAYVAFSTILGRRLGEMHCVLSQATDDPDFAPETADRAAVAMWRDSGIRQLRAALTALSKVGEWPNVEDARRADELIRRRKALESLIGELATDGKGSPRIRIHGDLHLGQTLVAGSDVVFIDFEGEPIKSLEERRAKSSPWRDVAGMVRSFEYAAAMFEKSHRITGGPYTTAEPRDILRQFRENATDAFLKGYAEAAPEAFRKPSRLLDLFLIDKAVYEITYEAANRPDWLDVPLRGLSETVDRLLAAAEIPS